MHFQETLPGPGKVGGGGFPHKRNVVSLRDDLISNVPGKISNFFAVEISFRVAPEDIQSTLS